MSRISGTPDSLFRVNSFLNRLISFFFFDKNIYIWDKIKERERNSVFHKINDLLSLI